MAASDQSTRQQESFTRPNKRKKPSSKNPETNLLINLNSCLKSKDIAAAVSLYEEAVSENLRLSQNHFQTLLYLCSATATDPSLKTLAIDKGFRVFDHMVASGINLNEASITSVARIAAAKGDGDFAFKLVRDLVAGGGEPRLRTYSPALLCFSEKSEADKAYEVADHMGLVRVDLEEAEIAALLKVSAVTGRSDMVYRYMHKLRECGRCVSLETAEIIESWFVNDKSSVISGLGIDSNIDLIRKAVLKNGRGWHGLGWLGEGKWVVKRVSVETIGQCLGCRRQLACVDISESKTEEFAESLAALALERESKPKERDTAKAKFRDFQDWLEEHSDYETIVDAANIGLYQQNFADGGFSIPQLEAVVRELYSRNGNKWPLVFLHTRRVQTLLGDPSHGNVIEEWINNGILYATPHGSNDDWYWLYAAVKLRCLLVTNDEMRDHIFELLGSSFIQTWKETHLVRYTFVKGNLKLHMPPSYSTVIQESDDGSWHVPIACDSGDKSSRTWLCITRPSLVSSDNQETSNNGQILRPCNNVLGA